MGGNYILALAPLHRVVEVGEQFPAGLPSRPTAEVTGALDACGFLHRDGLTFWTDGLEEFQIPADQVQYIRFNFHGSASVEVVRIAHALARRLAPLTLLDALSDARVQIDAEMTEEQIWERFTPPEIPAPRAPVACPQCRRRRLTGAPRCAYCGERFG